MASAAAILIATGGSKSGNPCARFIAPYAWHSPVISRITDSVNVATRREASLLMPNEEVRRRVRLLLVRPRKGGWGLSNTGHARWRRPMAYYSAFIWRVPRRKAQAF